MRAGAIGERGSTAIATLSFWPALLESCGKFSLWMHDLWDDELWKTSTIVRIHECTHQRAFDGYLGTLAALVLAETSNSTTRHAIFPIIFNLSQTSSCFLCIARG
jgi:hypothetical protein